MRARNSSLVLKLMWRSREISRADIARQTGLSRSTVSAIVNDLMETGLLELRGAGSSRGGRKPILIGFEDDAYHLVGVDVGATHIGVAITDLRGQVKAWEHTAWEVREDPVGALEMMAGLIEQRLDALDTDASRVVGIGVGLPSPIEAERPNQMSPLIHPKWAGIDIAQELQRTFALPVLVENDANLGALAERWWGAGRGGGDLAYIKIATGVGAGYIINDAIYRGAGGFAGEIGHTTISARDTLSARDADDLKGLRPATLNDLVGGPALVQRAIDLRDEHPTSLLAHKPVTIQAVIDATLAGDPIGRRIMDEAGTYLGIAVANLLNLLNPSMVVLGGALSRAGDMLLHPLRQAIRERTLWASIAGSKLVVSDLGERAIAVGAATSVLQAALDDHDLFPPLRADKAS